MLADLLERCFGGEVSDGGQGGGLGTTETADADATTAHVVEDHPTELGDRDGVAAQVAKNAGDAPGEEAVHLAAGAGDAGDGLAFDRAVHLGDGSDDGDFASEESAVDFGSGDLIEAEDARAFANERLEEFDLADHRAGVGGAAGINARDEVAAINIEAVAAEENEQGGIVAHALGERGGASADLFGGGVGDDLDIRFVVASVLNEAVANQERVGFGESTLPSERRVWALPMTRANLVGTIWTRLAGFAGAVVVPPWLFAFTTVVVTPAPWF